MRTPFHALAWEIWRQKRGLIRTILGILLAGWLFNLVLPESFRATAADRERCLLVNSLLTFGALGLAFGVFNHTEFNPQREWTGFPYRQFTLPVTTFRLTILPVLLGVAGVEIVYLACVKLIFTHDTVNSPEWWAVLIGAYMVYYQTILWGLAGFPLARMIVLGFVGVSFVGVAFLPFYAQYVPSPWLSEKVLAAQLIGLALASFLTAWACVSRQRGGGGRRRNLLKALVESVEDALPRRVRPFASAAKAQFWLEWRRAGLLLPGCVGASLLFVIAPISWNLREDANAAMWILAWTLAMPVILAAPIGKGFSKPDFWSTDLSLAPFAAVRPLSTSDMVLVKMRVAAMSAALSWALVAAFLSVWLPGWANRDALGMIRIGYWMVYDHSLAAQYVIAVLSLAAGFLATWKLLAGGFWIGLSGSKKLYTGTASAYGLAAMLGITVLVVLLNHDQAFLAWVRNDPDRLLSEFEWTAALALAAKFWLAARSWRDIGLKSSVKFFLIWLAGAACMAALALLLWAHGALSLLAAEMMDLLPLDVERLRNLLLLVALLAVPLARPGLAAGFLDRNRHGGKLRPTASGIRSLKNNRLLTGAAVVFTAAAILLAAQEQRFTRADAGGPSLRMLVKGSGSPTVVFESGSGSPLEAWVRVQPAVARFTRTVSYDRAGNGRSTKGPTPRDGLHVALELHTALRNADVPPPYILVGHSLGGPYIRVFAGLYPDEVAGMVLVDPTQEELIAWAKARDPKPAGQSKFRPEDEVDCAPATFAQASAKPLPANIPVSLITGLGPRIIPAFLPRSVRAEVEADQKTYYPAKLKFHQAWVNHIPGAQLIVTKESGHGIPFEEPELVVKTIHNVLERAVRQSSAARP